jgi:hypothetical protein
VPFFAPSLTEQSPSPRSHHPSCANTMHGDVIATSSRIPLNPLHFENVILELDGKRASKVCCACGGLCAWVSTHGSGCLGVADEATGMSLGGLEATFSSI